MQTSKIPNRLHEIADRLDLDLSDFEKDGQPIDWSELFGWMRHWLGNERFDVNEEFDALETELDAIELKIEATKEKSA